MLHRILLSGLTLLVSLASVRTVFSEDAPKINRLTAFATTNSVRIAGEIAGSLSASSTVEGIIYDSGSNIVWHGTLLEKNTAAPASTFSKSITNLKTRLWEPTAPELYTLKTWIQPKGGQPQAETFVRFGFRSFESRNGQFFFNGRPLFLRGLAINPPGRTIPPAICETKKFALQYVRFMKAANFNILRMTYDSQAWFEACDELGMLVYQGQYGNPLTGEPGKQTAPRDLARSVAAYKDLFQTYASHPSIIIYILSNELPTQGARGKSFHEFLGAAHRQLQTWDPTRLYIGNAGYGEGREGDICDVHRYWGWYYNTFLTYYNLRNPRQFGDATKNQPITFTECVGNFTGPRGDYNIIQKKQLGAQLNWTGHSTNQVFDALDYQAFMVDQAAETFRRLRPINPRLAGLMPFTILFRNWRGIESFNQMEAKPALFSLARAYQPVLLSWENWTPQVYSGSTISPIAHVVNDEDHGLDLPACTLEYKILSASGETALAGSLPVPAIKYYGTWSHLVPLHLQNLRTGDYKLLGRLTCEGKTLSTNSVPIWIEEPGPKTIAPDAGRTIYLFDPSGETAAALQTNHLDFNRLSTLASLPATNSLLIIGEGALEKAVTPKTLPAFIRGGGRMLVMMQHWTNATISWLPSELVPLTTSPNSPAYPPTARPFSENMRLNPERPAHPVLTKLPRERLALWSDYSHWNQTQPGFPELYPVKQGFKLKPAALKNTAVLIDYDRGLEGIALCEMFEGLGSVLVSGMDIVARAGFDPAADRLLVNMIHYMAGASTHLIYPVIDKEIRWGEYGSEKGLVIGPLNGLLVNADWIAPPTEPDAKPLTQAEGAWNTRPGDQFVPQGRCPAGPYGYSTASSLKDLNPDSSNGSGVFYASVLNKPASMTTLAENRSDKTAKLSVTLNDHTSTVEIPAHQRSDVACPIAAGTTNLEVKFYGDKNIVLLKTSFQ